MPELERVAGKAGTNKSFNAFRPITTLEEARDAQRASVGLAVLIFIGYALYMFMAAFGGRNPLGVEEVIDTTFWVSNVAVMVVAALLGLWVWARRSLIATVLLIGWYIVERVSTAVVAPMTQLNFMAIILLIVAATCAILSIRGHMAAAKFRKEPPVDPAVFG